MNVPYAGQVAAGIAGLDGSTLTGIVVTDDYELDLDHATAADVAFFESQAAGYARLTATASVERIDAEWVLFLADVSSTDLSEEPARGGVVWVGPGGSDAARAAVFFAPDPGGEIDPYSPTYDDGAFSVVIESVVRRLVPDPLGPDQVEAGMYARVKPDRSGWEAVPAVAESASMATLTDADLVNFPPTDGQVLVFDAQLGAQGRWRPGDLPPAVGASPLPEPLDTEARDLRPESHVGPSTAVGVTGLVNVGSYVGGDYLSTPLAAGAVPARAWEGRRLWSQVVSTIGAGGYPSAGFHVEVRGAQVFERAYDPANIAIELLTVHAYTDGDFDEANDYLEISVAHNPDGLHLGVNVRCNDELPEYVYDTPDAIPEIQWGVPFDLVVDLDPGTGIVSYSVDGELVDAGPLATLAEDEPSLPLTLTAPASTVDILTTRGAVAAESIRLREYSGSTDLILIAAADAEAGDRVFTSGGREWSASAYVSAPFEHPLLPGLGTWGSNADELWDLDATDSASWVLTGFDAITRGPLTAWWQRNIAGAAMSGQAGWGFASAPGAGLDYGFLIADGDSTVLVADSGELPPLDGLGLLAAVLDRDADELRLYTSTGAGPVELAATVDASALGAIEAETPGDTPVLLQADLFGAASFYRRALSPLQIDHLARYTRRAIP